MAKDDDRTNKPEEAGKWGTAGQSSGKNNKNGKGKEYKTDRRIDKVLQLAADRIDTIDSSASVPERLHVRRNPVNCSAPYGRCRPLNVLCSTTACRSLMSKAIPLPDSTAIKRTPRSSFRSAPPKSPDTSGSCTRMASKARHGGCSSCCKAWMPPARAASCVTCSAR